MSESYPGFPARSDPTGAMNFTIAVFTPEENDELRAWCVMAGVRLVLAPRLGGMDDLFYVFGPHGHRSYSTRDITPLTMDVMRAIIKHGMECQS